MVKSFKQLKERLSDKKASSLTPRAGILGADDPDLLKVVLQIRRDRMLIPLLIGDKEKIVESAEKANLDIAGLSVLDLKKPGDMIAKGAMMAANDQLDFLVRGNIKSSDFIRILFDRQLPFRDDDRRVCHVAVVDLEEYPRLLLLSDGMINVSLDPVVKAAIIDNCVSVARKLGVDRPRIGLLAAVEVVYPWMPVTVEADELARNIQHHKGDDIAVAGPISWDVATVPDIAAAKGAISEVAGQADILIAPNIETGNGLYKALATMAGARIAGLLVGGKFPVVMPVRCDSPESIYVSLLLAGYLSRPV